MKDPSLFFFITGGHAHWTIGRFTGLEMNMDITGPVYLLDDCFNPMGQLMRLLDAHPLIHDQMHGDIVFLRASDEEKIMEGNHAFLFI